MDQTCRDKNTPEVYYTDADGVRFMRLGTQWIQGTMRLSAPNDLDLEYAQRMMSWLLFVKAPSVSKRHIMQLGLGAGSLTKFSHQKLRMRTTAVEINPEVVSACRAWFKLSPDDKLLKTVVADALLEVKKPQWRGAVDVLQVDAYDHEAEAPVLDSEAFYADVHRALTADGFMMVNHFGRSANFSQSVQRIGAVFGPAAIWSFSVTGSGNTVLLVQRTPRAVSFDLLVERAREVETRWHLPALSWLRELSPPPR